MNRHALAALLVASLFTSTAFAQTAAAHDPSAPALRPSAGRVALHIDVTEARRVLVHDAVHPDALHYACTTPCRLYVRPGRVDVVLVGWTANAYHWDVPVHGGSVHLLARRPGGQLASLPAARERSTSLARAVTKEEPGVRR